MSFWREVCKQEIGRLPESPKTQKSPGVSSAGVATLVTPEAAVDEALFAQGQTLVEDGAGVCRTESLLKESGAELNEWLNEVLLGSVQHRDDVLASQLRLLAVQEPAASGISNYDYSECKFQYVTK